MASTFDHARDPHAHDGHHHHQGSTAVGKLRLALIATAFVALLELIGGLRAGSLALLSDAAHVSMDVVALAIALAASVQAGRPATLRQTFGFARIEMLAALANGGLLTGVTLLIANEAVLRFLHPVLPQGGLMLGIAAVGLAVNGGTSVLLARGEKADLNLRAAMLHLVGDAIAALAVIVGGGLILLTHAAWIDPALSLVVSAIILSGVVGVFRRAVHVLLESAPEHVTVPHVRARIREVDGVVDVHDLHVWTIGSGSHALAAHVVLADRRISEATAILRRIDGALRHDFEITHVTVQFECESCDPSESIVCTQVALR